MGINTYQGNGTLTIPRGYGFLYTWNVSLGDFVLCAVGAGNVISEVARAGSNFTITRPTEFQTQIACSDPSTLITAIFIGFV